MRHAQPFSSDLAFDLAMGICRHLFYLFIYFSTLAVSLSLQPAKGPAHAFWVGFTRSGKDISLCALFVLLVELIDLLRENEGMIHLLSKHTPKASLITPLKCPFLSAGINGT